MKVVEWGKLILVWVWALMNGGVVLVAICQLWWWWVLVGGIGWWSLLVDGAGGHLSLFVGGAGVCAWGHYHCSWVFMVGH